LPAPKGASPFTGNINAFPLPSDTTAYRYYGGTSQEAGQWVTTDVYTTPSDAAKYLSLSPGNTAQCVSTATIPKGKQVQTGTAAPAFGQPGGGTQMQLLEDIPPGSFQPGVPIEEFGQPSGGEGQGLFPMQHIGLPEENEPSGKLDIPDQDEVITAGRAAFCLFLQNCKQTGLLYPITNNTKTASG